MAYTHLKIHSVRITKDTHRKFFVLVVLYFFFNSSQSWRECSKKSHMCPMLERIPIGTMYLEGSVANCIKNTTVSPFYQ